MLTEKLTLVKSDVMNDWYVIERAEHDGREWDEPTDYGSRFMRSARIGSADIEGPADEMLALADAIEHHGSLAFKRCAAEWTDGGVRLWSPRNSSEWTLVSHEVALALAAEIRRVVGGK